LNDTFENTLVQSADGTWIAVYSIGDPKKPAIVLSNGLGGNIIAWRHLIEYFEDRFRILSWDYRGLYRSGKPPDPDALTMEDHCADLEAVLKAEKVNKAIFIGWSMGVQLNFEYYRRNPGQFAGLIQINGAFARPMETIMGTHRLAGFTPQTVGFLRHVMPRLQFLVPLATKKGRLVHAMKRTGFLAPSLDESIFQDLSSDFLNLDFDIYGKIFRHLAQHDATDVLGSISCPVLLLSGDKDLFTPTPLARQMATKIPDAELMVMKGGSHYAPVEFPELVNLRIEKFINERLMEPFGNRPRQ